jgi:hypothetical protein
LRDQIPLKGGQQFKVDREAFLKLARGTNLYSSSVTCIRELLQNAVDATLLRIWKEMEDQAAFLDAEDPIERLHQELAHYPIDIRIEEKVPPQDSPGGPASSPTEQSFVAWRIQITDRGTGISQSDLDYLQTIGSSRQNPERRRLIDDMPEWMRPSGIFGIGLQSVFMLTDDRFEMTTRHHETRECLRIELRRASGHGRSSLLIKRLSAADAPRSPGTAISFEMHVPCNPQRVTLSSKGETDELVSSYDFVLDDPMDYDVARIRDEVRAFAAVSPGCFRLNGDNAVPSRESLHRWFFHKETNLRLAFNTMKSWRDFRSRDVLLHYRGALVEKFPISYELLDMECDAYFGTAEDVLQINRNQLTAEGIDELKHRLNQAVEALLPRYIATLDDDSIAHHAALSLYRHLYLPEGNRDQSDTVPNDWRAIPCSDWQPLNTESERPLTLGDFARYEQVHMIARRQDRFYPDMAQPNLGTDEPISVDGVRAFTLRGDSGYFRDWHQAFFHKHFPYIQFLGKRRECMDVSLVMTESHYLLSKNLGEDVLSDRGFESVIRGLRKSHRVVGVRVLMPCRRRYNSLEIRKGTRVWKNTIEEWLGHAMVCPFEIHERGLTVENLTEYVRWTARNSHLTEQGHPPDELVRMVARHTWQFIQDATPFVSEPGYTLDEARRALRPWGVSDAG